MMKNKILILCTVLTLGLVFTGCGRNGNNNDTQAPYEDETNNDVNNGNDGGVLDNTDTNNSAAEDLKKSGGNLKDAGRNLVDSIQNAGSAIMDGVDNIGNDATNNANGR